MGGTRLGGSVVVLCRWPTLFARRERGRGVGGSVAGRVSRKRAIHTRRPTQARAAHGKSLGLPGRRRRQAFHSGSELRLVLRGQVNRRRTAFSDKGENRLSGTSSS